MKNPKISAVIFDMDGLIIDSEPLWKIAEIEVFKEVGFDFTVEMCALTTGMRIDEVIEFWRKKLKWQNFTNNEIIDKDNITGLDILTPVHMPTPIITQSQR